MSTGILKAFSWIASHGFVEKYNPHHYPKGHPQAGQFAKGDGGAGKTKSSHYPLKMRPIDRLLLKPPTLKDALAEFKRDGEWAYHRLETVPIANIEVPAAWHEKRLTSAAAGVETKAAMPPVQLSEQPGKAKLQISDGIHRTNASRQAGLTEVPAIVNRIETKAPTAERLKELRAQNKAKEKMLYEHS